MSRRIRLLLVLGGAALCGVGGGALRLAQHVHAPVEVDETRVVVRPGAGLEEVVASLEAAGLTHWRAGTRWGFRLWGRPAALKAGHYLFEGRVRPIDIYRALESGRVELVRVTLPEGLTAREMAAHLEAGGVTASEGFLTLAYDPASPRRWGLPGPTLEGFLFPDTYLFARDLPPETVIQALVDRFRAVARDLGAETDAGGLSQLEWVTLASIVEKETSRGEEKPVVAAVFLNRLRRKMKLETDPTVIYGIQDFDGNLRRRDLRRDTPYNTYTRRGLPPGPIANPGRESLEAVLDPADVPYLYFVSRNDGTHAFSVTYEEHRRAVNRFQKGSR